MAVLFSRDSQCNSVLKGLKESVQLLFPPFFLSVESAYLAGFGGFCADRMNRM